MGLFALAAAAASPRLLLAEGLALSLLAIVLAGFVLVAQRAGTPPRFTTRLSISRWWRACQLFFWSVWALGLALHFFGAVVAVRAGLSLPVTLNMGGLAILLCFSWVWEGKMGWMGEWIRVGEEEDRIWCERRAAKVAERKKARNHERKVARGKKGGKKRA